MLDDFNKIETSQRTTVIRDAYKEIFGTKARDKINDTLRIMQLYEDYWEVSEQKLDPEAVPVPDLIVQTMLDQEIELFTDQHKEPHIRITLEKEIYEEGEDDKSITSYETYRLYSKRVREYASGLMWKIHEKAPRSEQVTSALTVLGAMSREEESSMLFNRVAEKNGDWWIDMTNDYWTAIKLTKQGWSIEDPPKIFRRYSHQQALSFPDSEGSVIPLLDYVSLEGVDEQLLWLVTQITYLIPNIPHVITLIWGPKGAVKSTGMRIIREIIDPSAVGLLQLPSQRKPNELIQMLDHHYLSFFDNLSRIDVTQSDIICRAVTGAGMSKRRLYTDDEDITRSFQRGVGLNGINVPANRADLLDRCILLEAQPIPTIFRMTEKDIKEKLEREKPSILGGILDVLVKARKIVGELEVVELNRMADYTLWGAAITEALGIDHEKFLIAYRNNVAAHEEESIRSSVVGEVLVNYLENVLSHSDKVKYTPTQFYGILTEQAENYGFSIRRGEWVANARALGEKLNEIGPNLPSLGFVFKKARTSNSRGYVFSSIKETRLTDSFSASSKNNVWKEDDLKEVLRKIKEKNI